MEAGDHATEMALIKVLHAMPSLKSLLLPEPCKSWVGISAYAALAQHPALTSLATPAIKEEEIQSLGRLPDKLFPKLETLSLQCMETGFLAMTPFIGNIIHLSLSVECPFITGQPSLASFSRLLELKIELAGNGTKSHVGVRQLLQVLQGCP